MSLMDAPGKWIDRDGQCRSLDKLILNLNPGAPGVSETYERRERELHRRVERERNAVRRKLLL